MGDFVLEVPNAAMGMILEWGKHWLAPIDARIRRAYPELTAEGAGGLNRWCVEVQKCAFALVENDYPVVVGWGEGTAMQRLNEKYPMIDG